jgi:FtsZ-binding cell division protein ZapB
MSTEFEPTIPPPPATHTLHCLPAGELAELKAENAKLREELSAATAKIEDLQAVVNQQICPECEAIDEEDAWGEEVCE